MFLFVSFRRCVLQPPTGLDQSVLSKGLSVRILGHLWQADSFVCHFFLPEGSDFSHVGWIVPSGFWERTNHVCGRSPVQTGHHGMGPSWEGQRHSFCAKVWKEKKTGQKKLYYEVICVQMWSIWNNSYFYVFTCQLLRGSRSSSRLWPPSPNICPSGPSLACIEMNSTFYDVLKLQKRPNSKITLPV